MIKQAIIPLAGLGSRLLPLTSVMPKELLPINGKPNLEYIMEECIQAGVKKFIFVISINKISIKKYFFNDTYYRKIIKKKKDKRIIEEFRKLKKYQKMIKFVYQNDPKGTGDAVLKCEKLINSKFFLMLLPDDLIIKKNCSKTMIKVHNRYKSSVMASMKVDKNTVSRWGIFKLSKKLNKNNYLINDVIEKPSIKTAPSNKAVIGRYILSKSIFLKLRKQKPGKGGEVHITDAIQSLIKDKNKFIAHNFSGKYLDCGSMQGYIKSALEISKL